MKKLIWIVIIIAAIVGISYTIKPKQADGPLQPSSDTELADDAIVVQDEYIRYPGKSGQTALDLLEEVTQVEAQQFDFGVFVQSIGGVTPDEMHFWKLVINGQDAQVGADQYETSDRDVIEWRLAEVQENY